MFGLSCTKTVDVTPTLIPTHTPKEAKFLVSSINISPLGSDEEYYTYYVGERICIAATIENTGSVKGTYPMTLEINGRVLETRNITLSVGQSRNISFTVVEDDPGLYNVRLAGFESSFQIISSVPSQILVPTQTPKTTVKPEPELLYYETVLTLFEKIDRALSLWGSQVQQASYYRSYGESKGFTLFESAANTFVSTCSQVLRQWNTLDVPIVFLQFHQCYATWLGKEIELAGKVGYYASVRDDERLLDNLDLMVEHEWDLSPCIDLAEKAHDKIS